ncbi:Hsp20/alpha crystallin family protein [Dyadobacter sp. CY326]|uniref:Hsp20/alpha crystallin family protein n=1 Tax=Dyadobacter sp. CY326 TaxID=2907300 RepID=UPI001F2740B4|nr:Hsp20/alpha crystallin family protein [Dyadobacter sp. CY326]MCE7065723.1 Hsp20/alpha crystallin family protein [Dyadobacter sp. CY326]
MCGNRFGQRGYGMRHEYSGRQFGGSHNYRVPVNIIKNDNDYELMVFAPDRAKDDFKVRIKGHELVISYVADNEKDESKNWIRHEFSKASFERTFVIDETVDAENVRAEYINGILHLNLPIIPGSEKPAQEIRVI